MQHPTAGDLLFAVQLFPAAPTIAELARAVATPVDQVMPLLRSAELAELLEIVSVVRVRAPGQSKAGRGDRWDARTDPRWPRG